MEVRAVDVVKSFKRGASNTLEGVTFVASEGRITSLVGASGCGKTTTLRCVAGLELIDGGEIRFGEEVVSMAGRSLVPTARRNVGMVFQSYALWPHMTVFENIAFGLRTRGMAPAGVTQRVKEILGIVALGDFESRFPAQLSGGQQQRIALARALAYKPAVLLLDEPLANLDTHLRAQMRGEIRRIQRQTGITMIYVTHDRTEAMELSDQIVIMDHGRVIQAGSPDELYDRPANELVARFLGHANFVSAESLGRIDDAIMLVRSDAICFPSPDKANSESVVRATGRVMTRSRVTG
ncbi:MAG: ABC transporter ATP-binding protein, partial [Vulcanimicrobiaceae bacterium]